MALAANLAARGLAADPRPAAPRAGSRLRPQAGTPPEIVVETRFPEPTADAEAIERLLLARLERVPPPAAVARLELELSGAEPGGRPAAPAVRAPGAPRRPAGLAARAPRPDLRRGSGPAHRARSIPRRRCPSAAGPGECTVDGRRPPIGASVAADDPPAPRPSRASASSVERRAGSSSSPGPAGASRSRSATAGGSRSRGGASRSRATTSRSSASAGWRSSTSIASPAPGTSSASTTEADLAWRRSGALRSQRDDVRDEQHEDDRQDQRSDQVPRSRLHVATVARRGIPPRSTPAVTWREPGNGGPRRPQKRRGPSLVVRPLTRLSDRSMAGCGASLARPG